VRRADTLTTVFVTAIWGVAFVGIKQVLKAGPPLTMAGSRFLLAGALLLPLAMRGRQKAQAAGLRPPTSREVLVVGLLQSTALYGLGFLGSQRATAGASALLLNTNPVMVALLAVPLLGERLRPRALAGIVVAVGGVTLISVRSGLGSPLGIAFLLLGALAWAGASLAVKRLGPVDLLSLSCRQMLVGGVPLFAAGVIFEHAAPEVTFNAVAWFAFLVIPATALNFVLWFGLLERYSAGAMTSWLFLIPLFAVTAGVLILDEPIGWRVVVGGALVIAGVALTQEQAADEEIVIDAAG
jgi:O-acetylserine/cysteine efflux transporter